MLGINTQSVSAQNLTHLSNYSLKLAISPSHVELGPDSHPVGYVYVLNSNKVPIVSAEAITIELTSSDPQIASVPNFITLHKDEPFAKFDITTGILSGETTISASFNGKTSFAKFTVGVDETYLPDDAILVLNLPTHDMHVNSIMPFSVYLRTSDGFVIRAPSDIEVILDYEDSLANPNTDSLTIKKGEYYAWGTIQTNQKVGNTFLRALQPENDLDTAESISVSSTLPSSLSVSVFPKYVPAEVDRTIDVFVSLLDSDGNPAIASEDIPIKFFSNNQNDVGDDLDTSMKEKTPVIKKGEFGYHLRQELDLLSMVDNDITVGASAPGYGVAIDTFSTVGKGITIENDDIEEKQVRVFGLERIPSNATSIIIYQMNTVEDDDDDPEQLDSEGNPIVDDETDEDILIHTIDDLEDGQLYPIQASDSYYATGFVQLLDVVSGNNQLIKIQDEGKIKSSYSYGTATISSGKQSGSTMISANIKGVGSDSISTEVVNTLEQTEVRIFPPTGVDTLLFDRDGFFDVFLVSLDGKERPKMMEQDSKYLVTPTNGLLEIPKDSSFAYGTLRSDSFSIEEDTTVNLTVVPIGENANLELESTKAFESQPTSKIILSLPVSNLNIGNSNHVGVVQVVDLQGNPMPLSKDTKTKIASSDETILLTIDDATIPTGRSYEEFSITTTGSLGESIISASAKGVIGSEFDVKTSSSLTKLDIFTGGFAEMIPVGESYEVKLYVDDENQETIEGASVKVIADDNVIVIPEETRTAPDGSAVFSIKPLEGPEISLDFIATAEGYVEDKENVVFTVDAPQESMTVADIEFPEWVTYIIVFGIILVGVVIVLFLRKSKESLEEDWEEEEI